jgi:lipoate-protein ligase A
VETLTCRYVPYAVADGPHNMAADEVLLESAAAGVASVRFYGWSPATLSLGYFQSEQLRHADPHLATLPFVRRPSGGATLIHDREVTYALALPAGPPWQKPGEKVAAWLDRMHTIIAAALHDLGVAAQATPSQAEPFAGLLCFQHLTTGDLVIGRDKVVGSAQRRQRGALLQHGGILLAASPSAPVLPGIRELTGRSLTAAEICAALQSRLARETGWVVVPGHWTPEEKVRIEELVQHKYAQSHWNRKR